LLHSRIKLTAVLLLSFIVLYHQPGRQAILDRKKEEIKEREEAVAAEKKRLGLE
jgi:hypothetical protein